MADKLTEICEAKRAHVATWKAKFSLSDLDRAAHSAPKVRPFAKALADKAALLGAGLICEIKKASPSAGLIRPDFDPAALAQAYESGGAACLSVLTDEPYFQGCNAYLDEARKACTLPVLRKDFMIDVWQVAEARAIGADCILIIMAAVDDVLARELHAVATHYGMDVLIEVHDSPEMIRALQLPSGLIGINNRNLKTLHIDLATTEQLIGMVPADRDVISESGITCEGDIARLKACGAQRFLIGESLMRQPDVTAATKALFKP